MTDPEAKAILSVYRPDLSADAVPGLSEALRFARRDPALADWFQREQRFDAAVSEALQAIPVPEGLAHDIIEGSVEARKNEAGTRSSLPRRRFWLSAAAAATVLVTSGGLMKKYLFPGPPAFPAGDFTSVVKFRDDMARFANGHFVLAKRTPDFSVVKSWLKSHGSPAFSNLPETIAKRPALGCQTFRWGSRRVSLICFMAGEDEVVHLFITDKAAFSTLPAEAVLGTVEVRDHVETAGWLAGDKLFLLVGGKPGVKIASLLPEVHPA